MDIVEAQLPHSPFRQLSERLVPLAHLFSQTAVRLSWLMTFVTMAAGFVIIPNLSTYLQLNLGYPRAELGRLQLHRSIGAHGLSSL